MRKYTVIYMANLMSNLQYMANIIINSLGFIVHIFIFFHVWNYIYENPAELIYGFSKTQMVWYVTITEIIFCSVAGRRMVRTICNEVRSGNVAYNINKPYSYVGYIMFSNLGEVTIRLVFYVMIGLGLGITFLGSIPTITIIEGIVIAISWILSIIINMLFLTFIGLLAFIMEDSNPMYWLYSKMQLIFGIVFPLEFFPTAIQPIIKISPIFVTSYGPAKLFIDFNWRFAIIVILAQIAYLLISLGLCKLMYMKGVKKLNVNGG
ncbi:MAG: ABC transporter permease [Clostridia bacterium]|nr:ABC transporter permease [Clostridia bacterium]